MRDSAFDPPALTPQFWARLDVRRALERKDMGALFRLLMAHKVTQMQIATAASIGQNRVSFISQGKQSVKSLAVLTRIADGLSMPHEARIALGVGPRRPAPGQAPHARQRMAVTMQQTCYAKSPVPVT
jgi:hypothetical protein